MPTSSDKRNQRRQQRLNVGTIGHVEPLHPAIPRVEDEIARFRPSNIAVKVVSILYGNHAALSTQRKHN